MPQIGSLLPFLGVVGDDGPDLPRVVGLRPSPGNAKPSRLTQSIPSSFVKTSGLSKPFSSVREEVRAEPLIVVVGW